MTVEEFEERVWRLEGVRLVVRAPTSDDVGDYNYRNAATRTWSISEWLRNRVSPKIGERVCVVLDASGEEPHGRTLLRTIRKGYDQ